MSSNYTWVWWIGDDRKTQTKDVHSKHLGTWLRGANLESSPYWWLLKTWEQMSSPKERHGKKESIQKKTNTGKGHGPTIVQGDLKASVQ